MEGLGDLVELDAAFHDVPLGRNANVVHEGHQGRKDLGDAPAACRGIHVKHARAAERLDEPVNLVNRFVANKRPIVLEGLWRCGNLGQHRDSFLRRCRSRRYAGNFFAPWARARPERGHCSFSGSVARRLAINKPEPPVEGLG